MRIAKKLKKMGVKVLYYVAPQAWAWKSGRAKTIQKCIHTLFTILPFEKKWFGERGVKLIKAVSHPLYNKYKNELKDSYKRNFEDIAKAPRLLLLPGSRNSEVSVLLPVFCQTVDKLRLAHPHLEVAIVKSGSVKESYYQLYENYFDKSYLSDELAQALNWSDLAMAASGTVTLACALFQVPTIISYKTTMLNWFLFDNFVQLDVFVSLANIVLEQEVFPEYLQDNASAFHFYNDINNWLTDKKSYEKIRAILKQTKERLTGDNFVTADYMFTVINEK